MSKYVCECCNFHTNIKTHYTTHLNTKKHSKLSKCYPKLSSGYPNVIQNYPSSETTYPCKYCGKEFKYRSGVSKHIKYVCKKNKDEDIKELVRLLNESQNINKDHFEGIYAQINKLAKKLKVQNIETQNNNNGIVNNTNYNVKLLNFVDTDYSHLSNNDYAKCVSDCNHCVKTLIQKVHFNKKKPENMNLYIASMKDKYIMVYKNNQWTLQDRKDMIDRLYDNNECEIDNWYDEYKEKYPEVVDRYKRYQKNKEEQNIVDQVKELIALDCYNKRHLVKNNKHAHNNMIKNDDVV